MIKNALLRIILVIYLKMDFLKKFNLNLEYILTRALDQNNQDNALYKVFFTKIIDILRTDNFIIIEKRDKL